MAIVAIGRNEGERMVRCLETALEQVADSRAVIYVDSGSTDGSLERAAAMGVTAVDLQPRGQFTAARARNFGKGVAQNALPGLRYIQFLDADCEMMSGWIEAAVAGLNGDAQIAGVAGVLRERHPESTIYNRLCDMEWQSKPGAALAVGGNAMYRIEALEEVGGFDPTLIAGEEPELCLRLREKGWTLWRLDAPMAMHDAAMTHFGQWWRRAKRFGYAQTEVSLRHRHSPQRIWAREMRSTLLWALVPPLLSLAAVAVLAATIGGWWWLLGLLPLELYDILALKVYLARRRAGASRSDARIYATAVTLAKLPQFLGMVHYGWRRLRGGGPRLIEYKPAPVPAPGVAGRG